MEKDISYMELALQEAEKAFKADEVPVGAVLVDGDGEVVSTAHNLTEFLHDATAHAEMLAIRKATGKLGRWRLTGLTLYTTVEPCIMCAGTIVLSRIDRVVFGCRDPKFGGVGSIFSILDEKKLNHQVSISEGVLKEKSAFLMKDFFRKLRDLKKK